MFTDISLILILILANGFFAAAEMALVSARPTRLQTRANAGDLRARQALQIQQHPGTFLATVQVGITLVGTLASAFGGAEVVKGLAPLIAKNAFLAPYAQQIALGVVVITIAYLTLVIGELVPKRLAIRSPESFSIFIARPFDALARVAAVPISLLTRSADLVLRLLGAGRDVEEYTSAEEIEVMVRRSAAEGMILPVQERMIARIFDYADRLVRDEMTPRPGIVALEEDIPIPEALEIAKKHGFSRFPVYRDTLDHMIGYVHIKDLIWARPEAHLKNLVRKLVFIPESTSLPDAFTALTRSGRHMAVVMDEHAGTDGLITLENLLEVIVGEIEDEHSPLTEQPQRQGEYTWRINGLTPILDVADLIGVDFEHQGTYNTLSGFLMAELGKIPQVGDQIRRQGYTFTVESMDRFRVSLVKVQRQSPRSPDQE